MRPLWTSATLLLATSVSGCSFDGFEGARIELLLGPGTHVPTGQPVKQGDATFVERGRPPAGAHYELYAATAGRVVQLQHFNVAPAVDLDEPCAMESPGDEYGAVAGAPGLVGIHLGALQERLLELAEADGEVDRAEAAALVLAAGRAATIRQLQGYKAVVSHPFGGADQPAEAYARFVEARAELLDSLPPTDATDEASNRKRWQLCSEFFDEFPDFYVGSDRVLTQPLSGVLYGSVEQLDPRNQSVTGGADLATSFALDGSVSSIRLNWQFDDLDDARSSALGPPRPHGYHYMAGELTSRTRGTSTAVLANTSFVEINGKITVFPALGDTGVQF